jgi:hypothetical protein
MKLNYLCKKISVLLTLNISTLTTMFPTA